MTKKFTKTTAPKRSNWMGLMTAAARNTIEFDGRSVTQTFRLLPCGRVLVGVGGWYSDTGRVEDNRRVLVNDRGNVARIDNSLFQTLQALLA